MKYQYLLLMALCISYSFDKVAAISKNLSAIKSIRCRERSSKQNSLHWVRLKNAQQCVQIINDMNLPKCLFHQLTKANFTYQTKGRKHMMSQNMMYKVRKLNCETFLLFTRNLSFLVGVFRESQKHFLPFSYIYLLKPNRMKVPESSLNIAFEKGYNLFEVESEIFDKNKSINVILNYKRVTNLLTNASIEVSGKSVAEIDAFFGDSSNSHPLFNPEFSKKRKPFRINLFDCPPYVVVVKDEKKLT